MVYKREKRHIVGEDNPEGEEKEGTLIVKEEY